MKDRTYVPLETSFIAEEIAYTGAELRSHFVREKSGIVWDGVIAFFGACGVSGTRLVDLEDAEEQHEIISKRMLHFIGEHFQQPLREGNVRLRLFASIVKETLEEMSPGIAVTRDGDDLYINGRKLTVAICTASALSTVFHFGVNVNPAGAPVSAVGLKKFDVDPKQFGNAVLARYERECESIERALRKVRGVA
jgi:uncharacterized protein